MSMGMVLLYRAYTLPIAILTRWIEREKRQERDGLRRPARAWPRWTPASIHISIAVSASKAIAASPASCIYKQSTLRGGLDTQNTVDPILRQSRLLFLDPSSGEENSD
jgi:hypothetical protein